MSTCTQKCSQPEKSYMVLVCEWLNEISKSTDETVKVQNLCKIQEIVISKESSLLDVFFESIMQLAHDKNEEVRKTICAFIEDAGDKVPDSIPRMIIYLLELLSDPAPAVVERALKTSKKIFRATLKWIAGASVVTPDMEHAWAQINSLKTQIINMVDSDDDGIQTQVLEFLKELILLQTYSNSNAPKKPDDFSLEDVPLRLKIIERRKLKAEANHTMDLMIKFFGSSHMSSVNLLTFCMVSLSVIAKMRPQFKQTVIKALQRLQNDLPPTLSDSQVTSFQEQLTMTILDLSQHSAAA